MKRVIILFLLAAVLLCGCAAEQQKPQEPQEPYTQVIEGVELKIDPQNKTITAGDDVYRYTVDENETCITYPNGAVFTETHHSDGTSTTGWGNADSEMVINNGAPYLDGYLLMSAVPRPEPEEEKSTEPGLIVAVLAFVGVGIWQAAAPYTVWNGKHGWKYKDAEPSDRALGVIRGMGILEIIVGVVCIIFGF